MSMTTNKESFFELTTPRDMLEKAKRELIRLEENLHIDHVYNFFTTAYHIQDYLKNGNYLSQSEVDKFFNDQDLKDCRDICHKGKHLKRLCCTSRKADEITPAPDAAMPWHPRAPC
jgi:hypothetical protein